jgi:peptidoglycan/xylan/chitin deacetylase (PgdA/CDA1 family)
MVERWRPTALVWLSIGLHGVALILLLAHPGWWAWLLSVLVGNHLVLGLAGLWPRCQWLGPSLYCLPNPGRAVALTFDDGPDPAVTPAVLDLLATAGIKASFFCIADRARAHPDLVRRMVAAGHGVENHTLSHRKYFACLAGGALRREVVEAQAVLERAAGRAPRWFRPPMGIRSPLLGMVLARAGLQQATWSRRGYDTRRRDPAAILRSLLHGVEPGDVLLLHDGNSARMEDGTAVVLRVLPALLAGLAERGLRGVPLPGATAERAGVAEIPASGVHASR